jgi:hypothetical protein
MSTLQTALREPAHAADIEAVGRSFSTLGAVHVTDAVPIDVLADILAASERVFRDWDELAADAALPEALVTPHLRRFIALADPPFGDGTVDALLHAAFKRVARAYLEKEPEVDPSSHVRSILRGRPDAHLPFHQDQTILKRPVLNVWIPLGACGADAPGLELVAGSWCELLAPSPPDHPKFAVEHAQLNETAVRSAFPAEAFWRPLFRPGDAMLFAGATIHRTFVRPEMNADRMSVEIRLR